MIFRYHHIHGDYGTSHVPLLDIRILNPKNKKSFGVKYPCLVDSGASSCVFHAGMGEVIGLDIKKGKEIPLRGILPDAGKQYLHEVVIVVDEINLELKTEAGFTEDFTKNNELIFPWGILGQNGFFNNFRITFDLDRNIFKIK